MATIPLDLTKNNILNGKVELYQPKQGFRVGIDSILLASSVQKYSKCMEFGSGSGIILIYLAKRFPDAKIFGIEKNLDLVNLAKINLKNNKITKSTAEIEKNNLNDALFMKNNNNIYDRIIMNPPYFSPNKVIMSKNITKVSSRYEYDIDSWFTAAYKKLKPKGYLNFIYRSENLDIVLNGLYP